MTRITSKQWIPMIDCRHLCIVALLFIVNLSCILSLANDIFELLASFDMLCISEKCNSSKE